MPKFAGCVAGGGGGGRCIMGDVQVAYKQGIISPRFFPRSTHSLLLLLFHVLL